MRPAAFVITAMLSTWVLADCGRKRIPLSLLIAWTLGTLLFPFIIFPLYLIFLIALRNRKKPGEIKSDDESIPVNADAQHFETELAPRRWLRLLPIAYLISLLSFGALRYISDYRSVDAHLARATHARLLRDREKTIREYRAALSLSDDAHTHYLLGIELEEAARWQEALTEFRAAESAGEPDAELPFHLGTILYALNLRDEAAEEFRKFLSGPLCSQTPPDARCSATKRRD